MYKIEFEAKIENGIVRIPKNFSQLQFQHKAKVIVVVEDVQANELVSQRHTKQPDDAAEGVQAYQIRSVGGSLQAYAQVYTPLHEAREQARQEYCHERAKRC